MQNHSPGRALILLRQFHLLPSAFPSCLISPQIPKLRSWAASAGASALFWGLPLGLIVCVQTAKTDWLRSFAVLPPMATTGCALRAGSWARFKNRNVRGATRSITRLLALGNFGLSPFLYWWNRIPGKLLFDVSVAVLALSSLLFLFSLNHLLRRLGEMLPDEGLRFETRRYTALKQPDRAPAASSAFYIGFSRPPSACNWSLCWPSSMKAAVRSAVPDPAAAGHDHGGSENQGGHLRQRLRCQPSHMCR